MHQVNVAVMSKFARNFGGSKDDWEILKKQKLEAFIFKMLVIQHNNKKNNNYVSTSWYWC